MYPAFVRVPAVGEQELQMSHVDLPQRNAVALRQRQGDFIHAVIQGPAQTDRRTDGREKKSASDPPRREKYLLLTR